MKIIDIYSKFDKNIILIILIAVIIIALCIVGKAIAHIKNNYKLITFFEKISLVVYILFWLIFINLIAGQMLIEKQGPKIFILIIPISVFCAFVVYKEFIKRK